MYAGLGTVTSGTNSVPTSAKNSSANLPLGGGGATKRPEIVSSKATLSSNDQNLAMLPTLPLTTKA